MQDAGQLFAIITPCLRQDRDSEERAGRTGNDAAIGAGGLYSGTAVKSASWPWIPRVDPPGTVGHYAKSTVPWQHHRGTKRRDDVGTVGSAGEELSQIVKAVGSVMVKRVERRPESASHTDRTCRCDWCP
jgi:hypothetical protein